MKRILVTGAGGSAGNNVCWSLRVSPEGKMLSITGTDTDKTNLELNRWIDDAYKIPTADSRRYLAVLDEVVKRKHVEGIFPQPDPEVRIISKVQAGLGAKTFLPDHKTVSICMDKHAALLRWHAARLREPSTLLSPKEGKLKQQIERIRFPCWTRAREGAGGLLSCRATDSESLYHWIQFHWSQGIMADFVVERYLPGRDYCFMSVWNDGKIVTSMVRERLSWVGHRTIGTGGTSKLNHVVHIPAANRTALDAIEAVSSHPHGIFCVDMREDEDGVPRPTEINCRFTTNVHYLTLAAIKYGKAEWNFPWLAARLMMGERIPACREFDALPGNLWFTKNVDMGYTIVENEEWRAADMA